MTGATLLGYRTDRRDGAFGGADGDQHAWLGDNLSFDIFRIEVSTDYAIAIEVIGLIEGMSADASVGVCFVLVTVRSEDRSIPCQVNLNHH